MYKDCMCMCMCLCLCLCLCLCMCMCMCMCMCTRVRVRVCVRVRVRVRAHVHVHACVCGSLDERVVHRRARARRLPSGRRERPTADLERERERQLLGKLHATHAARPYSVVFVQTVGDAANEHHGAAISGLRGLARERVACLRVDARPPPVWQLWVPPYCGLAFVREMRLL